MWRKYLIQHVYCILIEDFLLSAKMFLKKLGISYSFSLFWILVLLRDSILFIFVLHYLIPIHHLCYMLKSFCKKARNSIFIFSVLDTIKRQHLINSFCTTWWLIDLQIKIHFGIVFLKIFTEWFYSVLFSDLQCAHIVTRPIHWYFKMTSDFSNIET